MSPAIRPPDPIHAPPLRVDAGRLDELARHLGRHAPGEGTWPTVVPGVSAIRYSGPSEETAHGLHQPAVCIVAQGAKRVTLGSEHYEYDAARFLVFSADLPVSAQVTRASRTQPYLCFRLDLEVKEVTELVLQTGLRPKPSQATHRGLFLGQTTEEMLDAAIRLMRLVDEPEDAAALAPLASRELVYRLLRSEQGERLARAVCSDGPAQRVGRAIAWLKANFMEPLTIEALAREAGMSSSSLHHHFKAVTSMSPLQFQKQLRLQEARRLLLGEGMEVATAGYTVGYESASQFSREYARLFGLPPSRDARGPRDARASAMPVDRMTG